MNHEQRLEAVLRELVAHAPTEREVMHLLACAGLDDTSVKFKAAQFAFDLETARALLAEPETTKLHPRTADLVARFSRALADKLASAETKYGYSDGWADPNWMDECRAKLLEHVGKGDPRDVAAYCAFLWHHGERTATPAGYKLVPVEPTEEMMKAGYEANLNPPRQSDGSVSVRSQTLHIYTAMLAAALKEQPAERHPQGVALYRARKIGGSYQASGTVLGEVRTLAGLPRVVFEFDEPKGMLHIFSPEQIEREQP